MPADEPTGALDSTAAVELPTFLRSMVDGLGQTLAMVTHDMMPGLPRRCPRGREPTPAALAGAAWSMVASTDV